MSENTCVCGRFEVVDQSGKVVETIECRKTTRGTFAPGHDAKLKGLLIRAGRAGHRVREVGDDRKQWPMTVARRYGFGHQVRRALDK